MLASCRHCDPWACSSEAICCGVYLGISPTQYTAFPVSQDQPRVGWVSARLSRRHVARLQPVQDDGLRDVAKAACSDHTFSSAVRKQEAIWRGTLHQLWSARGTFSDKHFLPARASSSWAIGSRKRESGGVCQTAVWFCGFFQFRTIAPPCYGEGGGFSFSISTLWILCLLHTLGLWKEERREVAFQHAKAHTQFLTRNPIHWIVPIFAVWKGYWWDRLVGSEDGDPLRWASQMAAGRRSQDTTVRRRAHPWSVLQTRMESSLHHNSVCTVDLGKKEALGLGSVLTGNH